MVQKGTEVSQQGHNPGTKDKCYQQPLPSLWGQLVFKHPQGEGQVAGRCLISSLGVVRQGCPSQATSANPSTSCSSAPVKNNRRLLPAG